VDSADLERVREHLLACEACRLLFAEIGDIHALHLPYIAAPGLKRDLAHESQIRNSILRAAQNEGARLAQEPELAAASEPARYERARVQLSGPIQGGRAWFVASAACLLCAGALTVAAWRQTQKLHRIAGPAPTQIPVQAKAPSVRQELSPSKQEGSRREERALQAKVTALEAERTSLERLLQESEAEKEKLQSRDAENQKQVSDLSAELDSERTSEANTSQKLEQLKADRANEQAAIAAQNREIVSLNEKLEEQAAHQDRSLDVVSAERDLRELVGSRNLHLVDVYDTDSDGKTRKAVGRVFYAEGQSLLFYAYDLSARGSEASKYAYYVWGNKDGNQEAIRNLGTLDRDDPTQQRWKLKVSDGKVLADIDRVFVTVEAVGKLGPRPRGKRILSAYLGSPANHP
jgi:hypothetical protein